ncbi:hypothetical protein [Methylogaea oryzae]|uniref:Uncharacterized protein n=1 Tax=Methylogaea oryzae TaxID=1295382 RepID=A0A8D4VTF6_9GAMM|nr:hypothetical protein [Methylogaea oryzae]BBL72199.1 hypothetical protein MoryE10_28050 [Methylogaea oryzae]
MNNKTLPLVACLSLSAFLFSVPVGAANPSVDEALALLKHMQPDRCALQKVRGKILIAHQSHDQSAMDALAPQMDAITARLKPSEEKLRELTTVIKQNPQDQTVYAAAQVEASSCH